MKLKDIIKENIIYLYICFIVSLIVLNAIFDYNKKGIVADYNELLQKNLRIKYWMEYNFANIGAADLGVKGYILKEDDGILMPYTVVKKYYNGGFDELVTELEPQGFDLAIIEKNRTAMADYMDFLESLLVLAKNGEREKILEIIEEDYSQEVTSVWIDCKQNVKVFEDDLMEKSNAKYEKSLRNTFIMQLLLIFLGIPILVGLIIKLKKNQIFRGTLFKSLDDNNKRYIYNPNNEGDKLSEEAVISSMISNLKQSSEFIKKISSGNFDVKWEGLNEENKSLNAHNIAGELVNMRSQMEKVKIADQRRIWETEGFSKFSEIVRRHQHNISELTSHIISDLVKYIQANQGGLFVLNSDDESDKYLELVSCYAYDAKKYEEKRIEIGQGLVGQTFKEKTTLHLSEIPNGYMEITSGLGDATASSLLIIPLKVNDQVEGVLELASFNKFEKQDIEFIEKLSEIIASGMLTLTTNDRTKILLETSQAQEEEMRAQEEEMRQNMEELQATQEEMSRQKDELELEILKLQSQIQG